MRMLGINAILLSALVGLFTPEENEIYKEGVSNAGRRYSGYAEFFAKTGRGFAESIFETTGKELDTFAESGPEMDNNMKTPTDIINGFEWKSDVPKDCPFERSKTLTVTFFTGRHSDYHCGDTFYPSWASDGNMYSPWTDGVGCTSGGSLEGGFHTAHAVMIGDNGKGLWLCYSANFSDGWNGVKLEFNPPGGRYGLSLHEVRLQGSGVDRATSNKR